MSSLPSNFPVEKLSGINNSKAEWFYRRYVEDYYAQYKFGHFLLAAYAAVPAFITPDLLYKIWQNFNGYKWSGAPATIHRIAVSDILLSPLCREVGFELYEMDEEIKLAFLEWLKVIELDKKTLWSQRGIYAIKRIAAFMEEYHRVPNSGFMRWGKLYTESQNMEALSYSDPVKLAEIFFEKIKLQSTGQQETELLRTMDQFIKTRKRLDRIGTDNIVDLKRFDENVQELDAIKNLIQNNSEAFLEKATSGKSMADYLSADTTGGIKIEMEVATRKKLEALIQKIAASQRKKIYACAIGINEYSLPLNHPLSFSATNAIRFAALVKEYGGVLKRDVMLAPLAPGTSITRAEMEHMMSFFDQAEDGDSCIFFYSGPGVMDVENNVKDVVFADDTAASINSSGNISFRQQLQNLAGRNIHVLLILDIHAVYRAHRDFDEILTGNSTKGSLIILQNYEASDNWNNGSASGIAPVPGNVFFNSLDDLLAEGAYRLTYQELFARLKLRMSRFEQRRPAKYAFPENASEKLFLTGESKKENVYILSFDKDNGWMLNAGAKQGIRPSLSFMQTLFVLDDGRKISVDKVSPGYSTVARFTGDATLVYNARLIQNALPKVKVAFAPSMDERMKQRLQETISSYDIYYIDLIEDTARAYYLIANRDIDYLLITKQLAENNEPPSPVFDYQEDPFEFIKQIEYIAQWQGVLEFDNTEAHLKSDSVWFSFEKVEGQQIGIDKEIKTELVHGSNALVLQYKKDGDRWYRPGLRCKVTEVKKHLYVAVLYLDATYGITDVSKFEVSPGKDEYVTFFAESDRSSLLQVDIAEELQQRGIIEITEYIKFFVSEKPMETKSLEQDKLEFGNQPIIRSIEKGIGGRKQNEALDTSNTDWVAITIPLQIVKKEEPITTTSGFKNPFKGLQAYQTTDANIYFGMDEAIARLQKTAGSFAVTIVTGPEKSGKTSLIQAGYLPGTTLNTHILTIDTGMPVTFYTEQIRSLQFSDAQQALFVDQYEQMALLPPPDIIAIETLLNEFSKRHKLIIAIRSEDEAKFKRSPVAGFVRKRNSLVITGPKRKDAFRFTMPAPSKESIRDIICNPLLQNNAANRITIEMPLVNEIIEDALKFSNPLPALSFTMQKLVDASLQSLQGAITKSDYDSLGGIATAQTGISREVFTDKVERIYQSAPVSIAEDLQKSRWGGKSENNDKKLTASIKATNITGLYNLAITIESSKPGIVPEGPVAFFLHNTFDREIAYSAFDKGKAVLEKDGVYEAFTLGAYTNDGTMLELDLNEVTGYPRDFYYADIPANFKENVQKIYSTRPVIVKDDLQKKRWGGLSVANGKELTAEVTKDEATGYFKVTLRLKAYQKNRPITGSIAFFLHDTFASEVVYKKAVNSEANIIITAYEAFTVGAYTADGTTLELDLNEVEGYPADFYYAP